MMLVYGGLVKYFNSRKALGDVSWTIDMPRVHSLTCPNSTGRPASFITIVNCDGGKGCDYKLLWKS